MPAARTTSPSRHPAIGPHGGSKERFTFIPV